MLLCVEHNHTHSCLKRISWGCAMLKLLEGKETAALAHLFTVWYYNYALHIAVITLLLYCEIGGTSDTFWQKLELRNSSKIKIGVEFWVWLKIMPCLRNITLDHMVLMTHQRCFHLHLNFTFSTTKYIFNKNYCSWQTSPTHSYEWNISSNGYLKIRDIIQKSNLKLKYFV